MFIVRDETESLKEGFFGNGEGGAEAKSGSERSKGKKLNKNRKKNEHTMKRDAALN